MIFAANATATEAEVPPDDAQGLAINAGYVAEGEGIPRGFATKSMVHYVARLGDLSLQFVRGETPQPIVRQAVTTDHMAIIA